MRQSDTQLKVFLIADMDARGLRDEELIEGIKRSSMEELTAWTLEADKVISF